jgi:hypothetical protein
MIFFGFIPTLFFYRLVENKEHSVDSIEGRKTGKEGDIRNRRGNMQPDSADLQTTERNRPPAPKRYVSESGAKIFRGFIGINGAENPEHPPTGESEKQQFNADKNDNRNRV